MTARAKANVQPALDVLRAVRDHASQSPKLMRTASLRTVRRFAQRVRKEMAASEPPERSGSEPFIYSYDPEKQRRARAWVAIHLIRGNPGGRYQRTHDLVKAYDVTVDFDAEDGGIVAITNDEDGAEWVLDDDLQVPSHYLQGWEPIGETAERYSPQLTDLLIETYLTVADPFAGIPE